MSEKKYLTMKSMLCYGFGIFGMQLFIGYINSYQSQFYSYAFGAKLTIVAVIILVGKIISAFADPFIGNLIDGSHFKSGKMKPFILMSSFPLAVLTTIMFIKIPFRTDAAMYVYISVTTVLWNIVMSFADIPSQGMLALLSPNAEERNVAAGIANIMKSIALAAAGVVIPIVCILTKSAIITQKEYLITAIFFGVLGLALYLLIFFGNKEVVPSASNKMNIKEMFIELKNNKMLMIVFLTFMLGFARNIGMGIGVQAAAVLLRDGIDVTIGSFHYATSGENLPWLIGLTSGVTAMVSIVLTPIINKKWGEKKTFIVFAVYGVVVSTIAFILYITGVNALRTLWAILVYQAFIGLMFGPHGYLPMVMVSDIVDYQEWRTGKRTEGTQFAVLSLSNKISNALSVAVGIFIVGLSGYQAGMHAGEITAKMQNIVFTAYILLPGICAMLAAIPVFFYKIDFKVKKEMHEALAAKRGMLEENK